MRLAPAKLLFRVRHRRVLRELFADLFIRPMAITHEVNGFVNVLIDNWLQRCHLFIVNRNSPHGATALDGNQHSLLGGAFTAFVQNIRWRLSTNIGFVKFNDALQQRGIVAIRIHHLADNMPHPPGRGLSDTGQAGHHHG